MLRADETLPPMFRGIYEETPRKMLSSSLSYIFNEALSSFISVYRIEAFLYSLWGKRQ